MAKNQEKKSPAPAAKNADSVVSTSQYASKIDAIKDIIFGEENAALRQSLNELDAKYEKKLSQLDDRLSDLVKELDMTLNNKLDNVEMDLKSEIDRLDDQKTDRHTLGKALEDLGKLLQE